MMPRLAAPRPAHSIGVALGLGVVAAIVGCGPRATRPITEPTPAASVGAPVTPPLALSGMASVPVVVLPVFRVSVSNELGWTAAVGSRADLAKALDAEIRSAVQDRAVRTWAFSDDLSRDFQRNPTYASDPYLLAEEPLRSPALRDGDRLPEPLASQLRTLVALRDKSRYVFAPVDVRIEPVTGGGQARLRLVLIDAVASEVRWIGAVQSDVAAAYGPAVIASLGAHVADLVAAP